MARRLPRSVSRSVLVFTALAALGLARPARAEGRLSFFPGQLTHRHANGTGPNHFADPTGDPTQCGQVTYCGGPVISNVQIVSVYWTGSVASATTAWAPGYSQSLANSALLDMLSEYSPATQTGVACGLLTDAGLEYFGPPMPFSTGQSITRGTATSAFTITPTVTTSTNITDDTAPIGLELVSQIGAGHLPAPTYDAQGYPNTLYVVYFPSNVNIALQGLQSCQDFGGYHYSAPYTAPASCKGKYIPYAVIPDCGITGDQLADVVSHEVAEAVTDTDDGPTTPPTANYTDGAWYLGPSAECLITNNCDSTCGEIGDVCVGAGDATVPGSSIISQEIWSQAQNNCAVNNPGIGMQAGPSGTTMACMASATDGGSSSSGGSSSGGGDGGMHEGGSGSGGSSGGASGSSSGGGSGSSSGAGDGGSGSGGSSGGSPFIDAGPLMDGSLAGADGGNGASGGGNSSGCGCSVPDARASAGTGLIGALLGLVFLGRSRRSKRR